MSTTDYDIGVQSFTYREFDVSSLCTELADTGVDAVELCHEHVTAETPPDTVDSVLESLDDAGLDVCGYGVVGFEDVEESHIRDVMQMVDHLGADYCSLEFPPADERIRDTLLSVAAEFDLELAIHNHGPDATYSTLADITQVLDETSDPRLGACVDTGHFLRSDENPVEVIERLGERVLALHLKDFVDVDTEAIPGEGHLDIPAMLDALDAETSLTQPLVIEYEADAENPTPAVVQTIEAVQTARDR